MSQPQHLSPKQLQPLVSKSLALLEKTLDDENIELGDRLRLALQILALAPKTAIESPTEQLKPDGRSYSGALEALEPGWRDWLIDNKQRGCTNSVLLQTMVEQGIDTTLATLALQEYEHSPQQPSAQHLTPESQRLRKLESVMATQRQVRKLSAQTRQIERRPRVSKQEFLDCYYATNTPVILTDMLQDWPALNKWTPEFLKARYGSSEVEVQQDRNSDPNYEINAHQHKTTMTLANYVDKVLSIGETNDFYMVANNHNLEKKSLKGLLDDFKMPDFLDQDKVQQQVFFWFGPAGTITPLHHDTVNVIMAHFYGRKRWRLISPADTPLIYNHVCVFSEVDLESLDLEKYPLFKDVDVVEVILEPGEIIFVPVGWWHQVKALDISISASFCNFTFPNQFSYQNPTETQTTLQKESAQNSGTMLEAISVGHKTLTNQIVDTTHDCWLMDKIIPGAPLLLSFGFVSWDSPPRFDFFGRSKKLEALVQQPLNRILLRDPLNAWYQRGVPGLGESVDDVANQLRSLIARASPSKVITIGQSMGGYAAILFGQLLKVEQILAFGPLSFLDSKQAKQVGDLRWLAVMEALEADPPLIFYRDLVTLCQIYQGNTDMRIFYGQQSESSADPATNLDEYHAQRLGQLPNCRLYPYAESGHAVVQYLIDTQQIDGLLQETIFEEARTRIKIA